MVKILFIRNPYVGEQFGDLEEALGILEQDSPLSFLVYNIERETTFKDLEEGVMNGDPDVVWCECYRHPSTKEWLPDWMARLDIPHMWTTESLRIMRNKHVHQEALRAGGVSVPWSTPVCPSKMIKGPYPPTNLEEAKHLLRDQHQIIVKPTSSGNSKGIDSNSIFREGDAAGLVDRVDYIWAEMGQPSLLERYIPGTNEFQVMVIGYPHHRGLYPIQQQVLIPGDPNTYVYSGRMKHNPTSVRKVKVDDPELKEILSSIGEKAADTVGAVDMTRMEVLQDPEDGELYVVDLNGLAGTGPHCAVPMIGREYGWTYSQVISTLVASCLSRNGAEIPPKLYKSLPEGIQRIFSDSYEK